MRDALRVLDMLLWSISSTSQRFISKQCNFLNKAEQYIVDSDMAYTFIRLQHSFFFTKLLRVVTAEVFSPVIYLLLNGFTYYCCSSCFVFSKSKLVILSIVT